MAGDEAPKAATRAKVAKLLELAEEKHQQVGELLAEVRALLEGAPGIGDKLKAVEKGFDAAWCARYARGESGRYIWSYMKDRPQTKRLLRSLSVDDIIGRAQRYISDDDPFYVRARHSFGLFITNVNRFAAEGETPDLELDAPAPVGCKHQPPCKSDAEHTQRRTRELRAS